MQKSLYPGHFDINMACSTDDWLSNVLYCAGEARFRDEQSIVLSLLNVYWAEATKSNLCIRASKNVIDLKCYIKSSNKRLLIASSICSNEFSSKNSKLIYLPSLIYSIVTDIRHLWRHDNSHQTLLSQG